MGNAHFNDPIEETDAERSVSGFFFENAKWVLV